ncbi:MAG TPA: response regulator [Bacteroidia bacterium]|nr:response regulator [Bacteroidia bacterium]
MGSLHICLIDDDEIQNFINEKIINRFIQHARISKYLNAQSAIDDLISGTLKPDIILLDINMPMMTGWDFMDIVEKEGLQSIDGQNVRIYILSSSKDPSDIEKMKDYKSLLGFFHKPLNLANLQSMQEAFKQ